MMISLPRHVRNLVRSSIIVPSKPLQGLSIHVPSSVVRPGKFSCNTNHTAQLVTGLDLVQFYHSSDINLQHPDYADEGTRLQSFKHWCGPVPATELADAGLYMVDYDTVKCYSCRVVIQGWKKGDKPIDMHCLHNSNCDFVKKYIQKLNEIHDICTDPRDIAGRPNERPVVKKRIKDNSYSSSTKPLSTVRDIKYPKVTYQTPAVHPVSQQSLSIHGHLLKGSTTKTSDDVMYTLPSEKIIVVSLLRESLKCLVIE